MKNENFKILRHRFVKQTIPSVKTIKLEWLSPLLSNLYCIQPHENNMHFIAHLAFVNTKLYIQISYETKRNVPDLCESVEEIEQHDIINMDLETINVNMLWFSIVVYTRRNIRSVNVNFSAVWLWRSERRRALHAML